MSLQPVLRQIVLFTPMQLGRLALIVILNIHWALDRALLEPSIIVMFMSSILIHATHVLQITCFITYNVLTMIRDALFSQLIISAAQLARTGIH